MLSEQAREWVSKGRRHVDIDVCSQTGAPKITAWAYDFDVMYGVFIDVDAPYWPSTDELKEKRVADLKRQIDEVAA